MQVVSAGVAAQKLRRYRQRNGGRICFSKYLSRLIRDNPCNPLLIPKNIATDVLLCYDLS